MDVGWKGGNFECQLNPDHSCWFWFCCHPPAPLRGPKTGYAHNILRRNVAKPLETHGSTTSTHHPRAIAGSEVQLIGSSNYGQYDLETTMLLVSPAIVVLVDERVRRSLSRWRAVARAQPSQISVDAEPVLDHTCMDTDTSHRAGRCHTRDGYQASVCVYV